MRSEPVEPPQRTDAAGHGSAAPAPPLAERAATFEWLSRITKIFQSLPLPPGAKPRRALFSLLLAVFAVTSILMWSHSQRSTLNVVCQHNFRRAELSLWIDGDLVYRGNLTGAVRRRFGLLETVQGSFSKSFSVSPGRHAVQVGLKASAEGYEATRVISGDFSANTARTLVASSHGGVAQLAWDDAPAAAQEEDIAWYRKFTGSALVTIWGSAMSAIVGFFVQEFLRSRLRNRVVLTSGPEKISR